MATKEEIAAAKKLIADQEAEDLATAEAEDLATADAEKKKKAGDVGPKTLEEALAKIKKLNDENAKARIKNKTSSEAALKAAEQLKTIKGTLGIVDETDKPEVVIGSLKQQNEAMQVQLSIQNLQIENGISGEQGEYFQFLLQKEFNSLGEGEEMTEEKIQEVVAKVKKGGPAGGKTSTGEGGKNPSPENKNGAVTLEQFVEMTLAERSDLYGKQPDLYQKLMDKARAKKLI